MITITIKTANAAFGETAFERNAEIARILDSLVAQLLIHPELDGKPLHDVNGNVVGTVTLTGKDRGL